VSQSELIVSCRSCITNACRCFRIAFNAVRPSGSRVRHQVPSLLSAGRSAGSTTRVRLTAQSAIVCPVGVSRAPQKAALTFARYARCSLSIRVASFLGVGIGPTRTISIVPFGQLGFAAK
jgi:hypothetical protein